MSGFSMHDSSQCVALQEEAFNLCQGDAALALQLLAVTTGSLVARLADEKQGSTEHVLMNCAAMLVSTGLALRPLLSPDSPTYPALLQPVAGDSRGAEQVARLANKILEQVGALVPDNAVGLTQAVSATTQVLAALCTTLALKEGRRSSSALMVEVVDALLLGHMNTAEKSGLECPRPLASSSGVRVVVPPQQSN